MLWHDAERAPDVLAGRRARPRRRRAVARRAAPAAGSRAAREREGGVHRGARHVRRRLHERQRTTRRSPTRSRRATRRRSSSRRRAGAGGRPRGRARRDARRRSRSPVAGEDYALEHGSVVIAAITSCTNTSNPSVMIAAGLLAKKAVERGLKRKPWVKSSLAPGSKVVTEYYRALGPRHVSRRARLQHRRLRLHDVHRQLRPAARRDRARRSTEGDLVVCAVLSGNRNFEARIHGDVKANYLASPPLVVAYALAGRMDIDLVNEPIGEGDDGDDVFLRDLWPTPRRDRRRRSATSVDGEMFTRRVRRRLHRRRALARARHARRASSTRGTATRRTSGCRRTSTACRASPSRSPTSRARACLVMLGDSVTTDHISPAGAIRPDSPAGQVPARARRRAARRSTRTARGAATTR